MNISETEKHKYKSIWKAEDYTSGTAVKFAQFVKNFIQNPNHNLLELGCGNGTTLKQLAKFSNAFGLDITIHAALNNGIQLDMLFEMPIWDIHQLANPHYIVSTDVLEHLPPQKVEESVKLIVQKTKIATIHAICTRPAVRKYQGQNVHLTVQPISWWQNIFNKYNTNNVKIILINTNEL